MSSDFKRWLDLTEEQVEDAIGPLDGFAHQCHAASIAIVKSDLFDRARVARGSCRGVGGQHSWVVLFDDCYDPMAPIVDVTLWSYDPLQPRLWRGTMKEDGLHRPHWSHGSLMEWGCPESGGEPEIELTPTKPLSGTAKFLLEMFRSTAGPLDRRFWAGLLSNAPRKGWPCAEFVRAAYETPDLRALIPIDRVGMETDLNPDGLYLKDDPDGD